MVKDKLYKMTVIKSSTGCMKATSGVLTVVAPFVYYLFLSNANSIVLAFGIVFILTLVSLFGISTWKFITTLPQLKDEVPSQAAVAINTNEATNQRPVISPQASLPVSLSAKGSLEPAPNFTISFSASAQQNVSSAQELGVQQSATAEANTSTSAEAKAESQSTASAKSQADAEATNSDPAQAEAQTSDAPATATDESSSADPQTDN